MGTVRMPDVCSEPTDYLQRPFAASKGWRQTNWVSWELLKAKREVRWELLKAKKEVRWEMLKAKREANGKARPAPPNHR